ncbi:hypothetical protein VT98_12851, partial [Candidatus Electrothrix communis]
FSVMKQSGKTCNFLNGCFHMLEDIIPFKIISAEYFPAIKKSPELIVF